MDDEFGNSNDHDKRLDKMDEDYSDAFELETPRPRKGKKRGINED